MNGRYPRAQPTPSGWRATASLLIGAGTVARPDIAGYYRRRRQPPNGSGGRRGYQVGQSFWPYAFKVFSAARSFGLVSKDSICAPNWAKLLELCTALLIWPSNLMKVLTADFTLLGAPPSVDCNLVRALVAEPKDAKKAFWTADQFPDAAALAIALPCVLANDDPSFL
jgi:hypothetical protein